MHQQDRAFDRSSSFGKIVVAAVSHIDKVGFDSAGRRGRRPALRLEPHWKFHRAEQLQPRVSFAPRYGQHVFFRVNIHARRAKRRFSPFHRLGHFRCARYAPANFIRQPPQVFFERRRSHHNRKNLRRGFRTTRRFRDRASGRSLGYLRRTKRIFLDRRQLRRWHRRDQGTKKQSGKRNSAAAHKWAPFPETTCVNGIHLKGEPDYTQGTFCR